MLFNHRPFIMKEREDQNMKKYTRVEPEASLLRCDNGNRIQEGIYIKQHANQLADGPKWKAPRCSFFQVEKECLKAAASVSKHKSNILNRPNDGMNTNLSFETLETKRCLTKSAPLNEDNKNRLSDSRNLDINVLEKTSNRNNSDNFFNFNSMGEESKMYLVKNNVDDIKEKVVPINEAKHVLESNTRNDFYRIDGERDQEEVALDHPDLWKNPYDCFAHVHAQNNKTILKLEKESYGNLNSILFTRSVNTIEDESMSPKKTNDKVRPRKNFLSKEDGVVSKSETRNNFYKAHHGTDQEEIKLGFPYVWKHPCDSFFASVKDSEEAIKLESVKSIGNLQNSVSFTRSLSNEEILSNCQLRDLLHYDISFFQGQQLFNYAFMLKHRISEKILEFKYPVNEELRFLCAITDGNQTERNQRLITERMCHILSQVIETHPHIMNIQDQKQSHQESEFKISNYPEILHFPRSSPFQTSSYSSLESDHLISNSPLKSNPSVSDIPLFSNYPLPATSQILTQQIIGSENKNSSKSFEKLKSHMPLNSEKYSIVNGNSIEQIVNSTENGNFVESDYSDKFSSLDNALNLDSDLPIDINVKNGFKVHSEYNLQVEKTKKSSLVKKPVLGDEDSTFCYFSLEKLLKYDVELMHADSLSDYSFAMKKNVQENIHKFENHVKEKLEFLCELTDGTQTEPNQKLITGRMCYLITNFSSISSHNQHRN